MHRKKYKNLKLFDPVRITELFISSARPYILKKSLFVFGLGKSVTFLLHCPESFRNFCKI